MSITAHPSTRWRYDTGQGRGSGPRPSSPGPVSWARSSRTAARASPPDRTAAAPARRPCAAGQGQGHHAPAGHLPAGAPDPTRYDVLLADPHQLGTRVRAGRGSVTTWYRIGQVVSATPYPDPTLAVPTHAGQPTGAEGAGHVPGLDAQRAGHRGVTLRNRRPRHLTRTSPTSAGRSSCGSCSLGAGAAQDLPGPPRACALAHLDRSIRDAEHAGRTPNVPPALARAGSTARSPTFVLSSARVRPRRPARRTPALQLRVCAAVTDGGPVSAGRGAARRRA